MPATPGCALSRISRRTRCSQCMHGCMSTSRARIVSFDVDFAASANLASTSISAGALNEPDCEPQSRSISLAPIPSNAVRTAPSQPPQVIEGSDKDTSCISPLLAVSFEAESSFLSPPSSDLKTLWLLVIRFSNCPLKCPCTRIVLLSKQIYIYINTRQNFFKSLYLREKTRDLQCTFRYYINDVSFILNNDRSHSYVYLI